MAALVIIFFHFFVSIEQPESVLECADQKPNKIVAAEQSVHRIVILDTQIPWENPQAILWEWSAASDPKVDPEHHAWFHNPSEVKPLNGGRSVMITASGGAVAVIDIASRSVQYYGFAGGNPHSVDMLPGGYIVSTSSNGDMVSLFTENLYEKRNSLLQDRVDYELSDGHGLFWDNHRSVLWALGGKPLKIFVFDPGNGSSAVLTENGEILLPVTPESSYYERHGGHDLSPVPCSNRVYISDMDHLWEFDLDTHEFFPFLGMHEAPLVKSISRIAKAGPILIVMADESWWTDTVIQLEPEKTYTLPGARFYKARWWPYPLKKN